MLKNLNVHIVGSLSRFGYSARRAFRVGADAVSSSQSLQNFPQPVDA
jgi:hypothetical protein